MTERPAANASTADHAKVQTHSIECETSEATGFGAAAAAPKPHASNSKHEVPPTAATKAWLVRASVAPKVRAAATITPQQTTMQCTARAAKSPSGSTQ